jgi:hypothetical protein
MKSQIDWVDKDIAPDTLEARRRGEGEDEEGGSVLVA